MDKMKGLAKGGWHPSGDRQIHRDSWKTDLKGMATGKKKDPYEDARNHQSAPLTSLRDPDSFGPPPKHTGAYGNASNAITRTGTASSASSSATAGPSGGWGSSAVEMGYAQKKREQEELQRQQMEAEQAQQAQTRGPYRADTTGLRTDNLPKPPVRRNDMSADGASPARTGSPALPPRQSGPSPAVPPRAPPRQNAAPPPSLPPRQNEYPDEYTPAPPPPYNEALSQPAARDPAAINQGAAQRLGQAGVNVAGFGIGGNNSSSQEQTSPAARGPPAGQLSELQQRFGRMNTGASSSAVSPSTPGNPSSSGLAGAAQKKAPPPPPPKKAALSTGQDDGAGSGQAPPPIPMSSKPRPS